MPRGIIVADGQFEDLIEFPTDLELTRFAEGVARGSTIYGAGSCQVLTREALEGDGLITDAERSLIEQYLPAD